MGSLRKCERLSPEFLRSLLLEELGFAGNGRFAVAFSGGADSSALLHAMAGVRSYAPIKLRAVHVHHGLQPEGDLWPDHCASVCRALGVELTVDRVRVDPGAVGIEAAARYARYETLKEGLVEGEVLLTAHHRDDQAETVLLQLVRGTGVAGLAGMPISTGFGRGHLVRPLLGLAGATVRHYALAQGLEWVEDPSNLNHRYGRNFMRHQIVPMLRGRWPVVADAIARAARHAGSTLELLQEIAAEDLARCDSGDGRGLRLDALSVLSPARRGNVLRHWLKQNGVALPDTRRLQQLMTTTELAGPPRLSWPGADVRRYRGGLYCVEPARNTFTPMAWNLDAPLAIPDLDLRLVPTTDIGRGIARNRVDRVQIRLRQGGERCRLASGGYRQRLKKLLQDHGVPPWERARLPLIFADGELAAVGGLWTCWPFTAGQNEQGIVIRVEPLEPSQC